MHIEHIANILLHTLNNVQAVAVECANERFQHVLMESWGDKFAMCPPMITAADQQTIAQPWLEETVFVGFVQVHLAAEYDFHIKRIGQEDDQFRTDPHTGDIRVLSSQLEGHFENFYDAADIK